MCNPDKKAARSNVFEAIIDEKTAKAFRAAQEEYDRLTTEVDPVLEHLTDDQKASYTEILVAHNNLVHETETYATDLISYMEQVKDMIENTEVDVLSATYQEYIDKDKVGTMVEACRDLMNKCIRLSEDIGKSPVYKRLARTKAGQAVGLTTSLLTITGGVAMCVLGGPLGMAGGLPAISAGVAGTAASSYAISQIKKRLCELNIILNDIEHRKKGAAYIRQNLNVIKQKCYDHSGRQSLLRDADIVIGNCVILRGY